MIYFLCLIWGADWANAKTAQQKNFPRRIGRGFFNKFLHRAGLLLNSEIAKLADVNIAARNFSRREFQ